MNAIDPVTAELIYTPAHSHNYANNTHTHTVIIELICWLLFQVHINQSVDVDDYWMCREIHFKCW